MREMTSRERVLAAIHHQQPDRVPAGVWATRDAYVQLRKYLGFPVKDSYPVGSTTWTQDCSVEPDVVERLGADILRICLQNPGGKVLVETGDGRLVDEWGVKRKLVQATEKTSYLEIVDPPLEHATVADLEDLPWPDPHDPAVTAGFREKAERYRKETPYAILMQFGRGGIFEQAKYLRGYEKIILDLATDPEFVHALFRKLTDVEKEFTKVGMDAAGEFVDILRHSPEDLGTERQPFMSPKMFRELLQPYYAESFQYARALLKEKAPHAKLMFHTCGAVKPLLPGLIEAGAEMLDPLQVKVKEDSQPLAHKENFGQNLAFWGGIDVQQTLPQGTPEDVRAEVRQRIREMGLGGGYILSSSHRLQPDIPPENVLAMYEACREFGRYPLV